MIKRLISTLLLTVVGTGVSMAQNVSTNSGTGHGYLSITYAGGYHTEDGVLFSTFDDKYSSGSPRCETLVKFPQNKQLTSYTVPDGVYCIARGAFEGNRYLEVIRIPSSVYYVGEDAFKDCASLKKIEVYGSTTYAKPASEEAMDGEGKQEVARYDLQGLPVRPDAKGIQIVVYKDYTTKTVINP